MTVQVMKLFTQERARKVTEQYGTNFREKRSGRDSCMGIR